MIQSQAFARKYRPQKFVEVLGQEHVTKALRNTFSAPQMKHHAFLFTGTRGVGKTTLARICAKLANCSQKTSENEPCLKCNSCLEIDRSSSMNYVELDGASNNGIEQIRQLIDATQYMPIDAPKKIYVIDEVHMLSQSAFNALLKTLEEPPAHVVFIFATTEVHKIPETILSRCLRFDLRPLSTELIQQHLHKVMQDEKIHIDQPTTLRSIAHCARGSVRDGLNLLEQVLALADDKKLTDELVSSSLGRLQNSQVQQMVDCILFEDSKLLSQKFNELMQMNIDLEALCLQLHEELYVRLQNQINSAGTLSSTPVPLEEVFWIFEQMTKDFQWVTKSLSSHNVLHAMLLKFALRRTLTNSTTETAPEPTIEQKKKVIPPQIKPVDANEIWQLAHQFLQNESPPAASSWAHTWGEIKYQDALSLHLDVCYKAADEFLVESFAGNQWWEKVREHIAHSLGLSATQVRMELAMSQVEEVPKSIIVQQEEDSKTLLEQRKTEILQNVGVRQIESLFNAKVDKVQLK